MVDQYVQCSPFPTFQMTQETPKGAKASHPIKNLLRRHKIKHKTSTTHHPQENDQLEVTNRALENILTKVVSNNIKYWVEKLV